MSEIVIIQMSRDDLKNLLAEAARPDTIKWLTIEKACEYTKLAPGTLRKMVQTGELIAHKVGKRGDLRFTRENLDAIMVSTQ